MKKISLVLTVLLLASPVFADNVQSEPLLTLATADTSAAVSVKTSQEDTLASDTEKEVKFFSRLLSAKIAADLPEQIAKEALVNVQF